MEAAATAAAVQRASLNRNSKSIAILSDWLRRRRRAFVTAAADTTTTTTDIGGNLRSEHQMGPTQTSHSVNTPHCKLSFYTF